MPYSVRKKGVRYQVVNSQTGKVRSLHSTRANAERQRRLLEGIRHGWKPTGRKSS